VCDRCYWLVVDKRGTSIFCALQPDYSDSRIDYAFSVRNPGSRLQAPDPAGVEAFQFVESTGTVTALIRSWREGDQAALDRLVPLVYAELRRMARARLRALRDHSLQPTALVHEAYLRLVGLEMPVHDRTHFFALAARLMRQILVDHARRKQARKRGGGLTITSLENVSEPVAIAVVDILVLEEALQELASFDQRACRVVELRYFAGLKLDEAAEALGVSTATVERDWAVAKAWLSKRLSPPA
jgi:RNA polymerase sigma factor (TIGR02999 family)